MKKLLISIFFLNICYAQDLLNIKYSAGPVFPIAKIASNDIADSSAGHTTTGGLMSLQIALKPTKYIGFTFNGGLGMLPIRHKAYEEYAKQTYGIEMNAITQNYRLGYASGGVYFSIKIKEYWSIDARITGGYLWAEIPNTELSNNGTIYYKEYLTAGGGWMTGCGIGFRRVISPVGKPAWPLFFGAQGEFVYARPIFNNVIVEQRVGSTNITRQHNFTQSIGLFSIQASIGLTF